MAADEEKQLDHSEALSVCSVSNNQISLPLTRVNRDVQTEKDVVDKGSQVNVSTSF